MLSERLAAYMQYFETLAEQPPNHWDGFYITQHEQYAMGLRYQIAFSCIALGCLCIHTNAEETERVRCRQAMAALIDRMQQRRVWAYWAIAAERHGLNPNPIEKANAQYSGLLAMMIGVFEAVGGDSRYDDTFTLLWTGTEQFTTNHNSLVYALWQQMYNTRHRGIDSTPGKTYTAHMAPVLWGTLLHDGLHGSIYKTLNDEWLAHMHKRLVIRGIRLPGRGVLSALYLSDQHIPLSLSSNFLDSYTLALLTPLDSLSPLLVKRLFKAVRYVSGSGVATQQHAFVPSAAFWSQRDKADTALTTALSYIVAVQTDHHALAHSLLSYADTHLQPMTHEGARWYAGSPSHVYLTALITIGEAGGLGQLRDVAYGARAPLEPNTSNVTTE